MSNIDNEGLKRQKKPWGIGPIIGIIIGSAMLVTIIVGALLVGYMILDLPDISRLRSYNPPRVTEVYDEDHHILAYWYNEKRWPIPRDKIPQRVINAFLAAEDARFYEHPGVDLIGVLRAAIKDIEAGGIVQGASTITQQVTRSLLLSPEKSWIRKIKEAILAWQIDKALSKDEIITIYLNQIYLGYGAYGIEAAARTYFGKHVNELNLAETAMLAGLPQAPSRYSPFRNLALAKKRQEYVLRRMVDDGFITKEEAEKAKKTPIILKPEEIPQTPGVEYFLSEVRKELEEKYGEDKLFNDGLTIITTLKRSWQIQAYKSTMQGLKELIQRHPEDKELPNTLQAAFVAMDLKTGAVRAMLGGKDFRSSQFNYATQGKMQPGSAFKPVVYTTALAEKLISPNSIMVDEPISLTGPDSQHPWMPENFDKKYMGPITIRTALALSRNVIAVKLARMVGVKAIQRTARLMGIEAPLANDLSISLGSSAVPLIQLVQAYSTFPNLGKTVRPMFVEKVIDKNGNILEESKPSVSEATDPITAYQMVTLLEAVIQEGTGIYAKTLGIPAGGKTGTTDNYKDALFIGFTPETVAGVWVGRQDMQSLGRLETGGRAACPIWTSFMETTKKDMKKDAFDIPKGVTMVAFDKNTGDIVPYDQKDDNPDIALEPMPSEAVQQTSESAQPPQQQTPTQQKETNPPPSDSGRLKLPTWLKF
ncbi:penicillin-binding protein 1A [Dissulfurimicrobium hydrothermale]|uniref:penicillin-binding protein 1A n=1 Tax=Dissulfurimicrobium hydrothermale TaxID=1750598 RepID=UPI001EDA728A|nr:PBP1A family penicillin-binding protein [Dissulfurimicrobium hydrothermale]UKL13353.1 PBP1A family penicillin-binding protein [Dissulfurimicrobium hydrothermale]